MEEIDNIDNVADIPNEIILFPPDNANEYNTDEDSGDENDVVLNNLPGSQLRGIVEVSMGKNQEDRKESEDVIDDVTVDNWNSDDDLPLSTFVQRKIKKTKEFHYLLGKDIEENFPIWNSVFYTKNNRSPASIFKSFFDKNLIDKITQCTNLYASQKNVLADVIVDDIYCFIGVLLVSGFSTVSRKKMYWQNSADSNNALISSSISRDRFQYVMSNFHCVDNNNLEKDDRFAKVRPLFQELNKKFLEFAPTEENHSVDEAMVPYFGRHGCKQFIKGKPIRWGYKFWVGTTRLGYILYFEPYQGATTILSEKYKDLGLGASVVLQYVDVLQSTGFSNFHIFFDNFFTSLSLMKELTFRKIRATGTIRDNRLPKCPFIDVKAFKKKSRGDYQYALVDNETVLCRWNDNNVITIASNASSVLPTNKTKRFSQKEKQHIYIDQPKPIKGYNENMGGVDRSDQNIGQYRISIRGKKWYFPLISQCIDMANQNAWYLHRFDGGRLDQLAFRRAVAVELLETHKVLNRRGASRRSGSYKEHSRYDRIDHMVIYQNNQTKCAVCHKKTNFRCEKCDIGLHPKDCFRQFHTL